MYCVKVHTKSTQHKLIRHTVSIQDVHRGEKNTAPRAKADMRESL